MPTGIPFSRGEPPRLFLLFPLSFERSRESTLSISIGALWFPFRCFHLLYFSPALYPRCNSIFFSHFATRFSPRFPRGIYAGLYNSSSRREMFFFRFANRVRFVSLFRSGRARVSAGNSLTIRKKWERRPTVYREIRCVNTLWTSLCYLCAHALFFSFLSLFSFPGNRSDTYSTSCSNMNAAKAEGKNDIARL